MLKKLILISMSFAVLNAAAQNTYTPSPENLKAREWFQDAKFGMFIHWGVYSILGDGEWVMNNQRIDKQTYQKLPAFFNPISYDPAEWVALAKAAGMKYITLTSKHHDGFAMWDSKLTDWDIVDRTPYGKDIIKMLADECKKQGIKLFFYHSQLDWYQEDYYPRGNTGSTAGRPEKGDWYKYLDYMDGQLTELLTNYGEIGGIWFDGFWDKKDADWRLDKTYGLIHKLQPACLVGSNHHLATFPGEDFQMFEKDLPGQKTTGFNPDQKMGELPYETCETMNNSWGFNLQDKNYKSTKNLIQYLVKAAGFNSNFLLNVGPMPDGRIQPEFIKTLGEIGKWMEKNGETIYGTRGGPVSPRAWGVTTQKGNKVFVHVLNPEDNNLLIPDFGAKVKKITFFGSGEKLKYRQDAFGIAISVPEGAFDEIDTILVMEL
ncbi:MAG TPA: alpha-L-fucosidase [Bacteroidales bacterium]|jgi:alpha-L-fucosidase|nr:alpha-L-fucosidase [Bacteroidales bacterium]MDI9553988.1 alpha-L-fucosidase [Bacteroidota bacterium]MZP65955.1 alpha-L-fucosidase [Bacteroidales bacterium]NLK54190.1 alpha-L-fucosidase [Bacteroidales bacterium]HNY53469.1 alpha-L-fucosidase [Bacteroidales bacterium]